MSTKLLAVTPQDSLTVVKEIFDTHRIHHVPVVRYKSLVGIISKSDFLYFLRGVSGKHEEDRFINEARLNVYKAEDIMTKGLAKVEPSDRINVVLEIFKENLFHAIPVVEEGELVGLVTTYDIIKALADDKTPV